MSPLAPAYSPTQPETSPDSSPDMEPPDRSPETVHSHQRQSVRDSHATRCIRSSMKFEGKALLPPATNTKSASASSGPAGLRRALISPWQAPAPRDRSENSKRQNLECCTSD